MFNYCKNFFYSTLSRRQCFRLESGVVTLGLEPQPIINTKSRRTGIRHHFNPPKDIPPAPVPLPQIPAPHQGPRTQTRHRPPALLPPCVPTELVPSASPSLLVPESRHSPTTAQPPREATRGPHGNVLGVERGHQSRGLHPPGILTPLGHYTSPPGH